MGGRKFEYCQESSLYLSANAFDTGPRNKEDKDKEVSGKEVSCVQTRGGEEILAQIETRITRTSMAGCGRAPVHRRG